MRTNHPAQPGNGSSPRLRGTLVVVCSLGIIARFIPAFAGNTTLWSSSSFSCLVHPRVCGEHGRATDEETTHYGSSPRLRGTHTFHLFPFGEDRFIPAFAGNTRPSRARRRRRSVHPRVCGEHRPVHRQGACGVGSSPRLRGTRAWCRSRRPDRRFIPAFAGNTSASATCLSIVTVHPRVCGEHECFCTNHCPHIGSSPRLRGTPKLISINQLSCRFIPAFAGNTR